MLFRLHALDGQYDSPSGVIAGVSPSHGRFADDRHVHAGPDRLSGRKEPGDTAADYKNIRPVGFDHAVPFHIFLDLWTPISRGGAGQKLWRRWPGCERWVDLEFRAEPRIPRQDVRDGAPSALPRTIKDLPVGRGA